MDVAEKTTYYKKESPITSENMIITIFDGSNQIKEINLRTYNKSIITFGRSETNDIILTSSVVSRKHGCFRIEGNSCVIEDLNSTNGLILDGKTIKSRKLEEGDTVRIDDIVETKAQGVLIVFSKNIVGDDWRDFPLAGIDSVSIGRDSSCDIRLDHVTVSKLHAKIIKSDSKFYIYDNNSTNGITINGKKVGSKTELHEKDVILITNSKLIFTRLKISYCCFKKGINLEARNISKVVTGAKEKKRKVICDKVSVNINPCELVAIIGGSGAGKSTVMNCISGYNAPTEGNVLVNGVNLYQNFEVLKNIIGYVPQADIVYDNLSVAAMLEYTANLRLPHDTLPEERSKIVDKVIATVELLPNKNTLIKQLSGGQRKRASIAVELLSDPNLFFLDEPASGLDPGTERNLMHTLKSMAENGKTVILVTHSTLNLHICDKILFMGRGGKLCFFGSYREALEFFGVDDIVNVYNMITEDPDKWRKKYLEKQTPSNISDFSAQSESFSTTQFPKKGIGQFAVLCRRYMHLVINDRQRLLLVMLQAPLLALLISFVSNGNQFDQFEITKSLLFALSCSAFWIGTLNSIQEICKERNIFRREYMAGLRMDSYILSKLCVLGILCAVQSLMLVVVFALLVGIPQDGVFLHPFAELFITTLMTALAATAMGIFVSSLFKNADRVMTVAPLLLMPQILFSGLIFTLDGVTEIISWLAVCRWSMEGLGTTANLNDLPLRLQQEGLPIEHIAEDFYMFTKEHLLSSWGILMVFVILFSILSGLALRNIKKERT